MLFRIMGAYLALSHLLGCAHEVPVLSPLESTINELVALPPSGKVLFEGRTLSWAEYGAPDGVPVFYLSGGDSSRLEGASLAEVAEELHVRIIAPDRPGFGDSDAAPNRQLVEWPRDLSAIADHLGLERFSVVGLSGGGPHALVTAWALPERVDRLVVVASAPLPELESETRDVAFPFRMIATLTRHAPWAMKFVLSDQMKMSKNAPGKLLERTRSGVQKPDAEWLADDKGGALFAASMRLAYQNGVEGSLHEHRLYRQPWGFALEEIRTQTHFFIGEEDVLASRIVNEKMASLMPNADLTTVAHEGHLSLIPNHARRILRVALGR